MAKTLKQFKELYTPKAADEKKFVDKHVVKKHGDRNGNDDKLFKASNVKPVKRATEHGYETVGQHDDEKVYEEVQVDEKIHMSTAKMGDVIKDFQKSKAPQFAGKSKEKRREMAIAAKLQAEEAEQIDELSTETRKSYLLKAAPLNRQNPTKKRSVGINRALMGAPKKAVAEETVEEEKNIVDKSGAIHTPMSRTRHLAKMALKKEIEKHAKEAAASVTKKKTNEEVNYEDIKQYLLAVYEDKLNEEEQQILNEMLETEEGAKLAFVITYFSGE